MKKKQIKILKLVIKVVLTLLVFWGMYSGYKYVHDSFNQNAQSVNDQVNKRLPKLKYDNTSLQKEKRNAYDEKLIVNYHYKKAFSSPLTKDKTLKKMIRERNNADDHLENATQKLKANQNEINNIDKKYYSKTDLHNSQSNLKIIVIILTLVILFFVWSI